MLQIKRASFIIENNLNNSFLLLIVLLSVLISVLFINYLLIGIAAIILSLLVFIYGERFLIGLIIVSLFTLVSDLGTTLRLYVHLIDFSLLGYLFIKKYGFNFSEYPKLPKPLIYFLLLYYFAMIITTIFSEHILIGIDRISRQSVFFIIAYIFFSFLKDIRYVKIYVIALVIVSLILALSSIFQFSAGGFKLLDFALGVRYRVTGLISNVDATTAFFILTFPLVITLSFSKTYKNKQPLFLLIIFILTIGIFLTTSRSAIMAILVSLLFILFYLKRDLFKKLIVILVVIVLLIIFIPTLSQLTFIFRVQEGLSNRDYLWKMAFDIIKDNPVLGIGPGAYKFEMFNYFPVMLNTWIGNLFVDLYIATGGANNAHSIFLKFTSDMGIPGLIALFYFITLYFQIAARTIKKARYGNLELFLIILSISVTAGSMFIRGIFDSIGILTYGIITDDLPFWLWFGILIFFYQKPKEYFLEKGKTESAGGTVLLNE